MNCRRPRNPRPRNSRPPPWAQLRPPMRGSILDTMRHPSRPPPRPPTGPFPADPRVPFRPPRGPTDSRPPPPWARPPCLAAAAAPIPPFAKRPCLERELDPGAFNPHFAPKRLPPPQLPHQTVPTVGPPEQPTTHPDRRLAPEFDKWGYERRELEDEDNLGPRRSLGVGPIRRVPEVQTFAQYPKPPDQKQARKRKRHPSHNVTLRVKNLLALLKDEFPETEIETVKQEGTEVCVVGRLEGREYSGKGGNLQQAHENVSLKILKDKHVLDLFQPGFWDDGSEDRFSQGEFLRKKYNGDHNKGKMETWFQRSRDEDGNGGDWTCAVIVQELKFTASDAHYKSAQEKAACKALRYFEENPPSFINPKLKNNSEPFFMFIGKRKKEKEEEEKKEKNKKKKVGKVDPTENYKDRPAAVGFPNELFEKCWKHLAGQLLEIPEQYTLKHNCAFIVQVTGGETEPVAMGSGSKVISPEYDNSEGTAIRDCTASSLCVRAFRSYLLHQLTELHHRRESVFLPLKAGERKNKLRNDVGFILVLNSSPMGDCKLFDSDVFQHFLAWDPKDGEGTLPKLKGRNKRIYPFDTTLLGKLQQYRRMKLASVLDQCCYHSERSTPYLADIVSPSDKLALRNVTGFQGALLSSLVQPLRFPDVYVGRSFDREALERGMFGRLGPIVPEAPRLHQITWKPSKMADRCSLYGLVWSKGGPLEVIRTDIGCSVPLDTLWFAAKSAPATTGQEPYDPTVESEAYQSDCPELQNSVPSRYCSLNFYNRFTQLLQLLKKPVQRCEDLKLSSVSYQLEKKKVKLFYAEKNLGDWPKRTCKHDF